MAQDHIIDLSKIPVELRDEVIESFKLYSFDIYRDQIPNPNYDHTRPEDETNQAFIANPKSPVKHIKEQLFAYIREVVRKKRLAEKRIQEYQSDMTLE